MKRSRRSSKVPRCSSASYGTKMGAGKIGVATASIAAIVKFRQIVQFAGRRVSHAHATSGMTLGSGGARLVGMVLGTLCWERSGYSVQHVQTFSRVTRRESPFYPVPVYVLNGAVLPSGLRSLYSSLFSGRAGTFSRC